MIQKIIPTVASITLIGSASLTDYADDMLDKDYTVSKIWSEIVSKCLVNLLKKF